MASIHNDIDSSNLVQCSNLGQDSDQPSSSSLITNTNDDGLKETQQKEQLELEKEKEKEYKFLISRTQIVQESMLSLFWSLITSFCISFLIKEYLIIQDDLLNVIIAIISLAVLFFVCYESKRAVHINKSNYIVIRILFVIAYSSLTSHLFAISNMSSVYEIQLILNAQILFQYSRMKIKIKLDIKRCWLINIIIPIVFYQLLNNIPLLPYILATIPGILSGIALSIAVKQILNGEESINEEVEYPLLPVQIFAKILLPTLKNRILCATNIMIDTYIFSSTIPPSQEYLPSIQEYLPSTQVYIIASILAYLSGIAESIVVQQMMNGMETINYSMFHYYK